MAISKNNTGDLEQQIQSLQDEVTVLRKSNAELNESLKAYSQVNLGQISLINKFFDKVPFGVMLLDEQNKIIHANSAAEKMFETSCSEMNGQLSQNFFKCVGSNGPCSVVSVAEDVNLEQLGCLNNGKFVMHSSFESNEGSEKVFVSIFIDITEIIQAEQELIRVNKTKDEFIGMISHELRTPLNVIQGYSSLLEEEIAHLENKDASMYVEAIQESGEILHQVVNNLLELSNLTAGKVKVDNIPIELDMIVTQLQYRMEKAAATNGNKLVIKADEIKPFEQDLVLLMKVLYELLINANKFTTDGVLTMTVSLLNKDGSDWLCFKVADTGCGMTEDTMKLIFIEFHQADSSITRSYEGLGLGLGIVGKIVQLLRGKIEVESRIGEGSTFTMLLPYNPV